MRLEETDTGPLRIYKLQIQTIALLTALVVKGFLKYFIVLKLHNYLFTSIIAIEGSDYSM